MEALLTVGEPRKTNRRDGGVFSPESDGARFTAVDGTNFSVARGETFAVVGESGCGKTTLARMLLRLIEPDGGELLALRGEKLRAERCQMQMIFQDPFASPNSRMRVGEIVAEPLAIHLPVVAQVATRIAVMRAGRFPGSRRHGTGPPSAQKRLHPRIAFCCP